MENKTSYFDRMIGDNTPDFAKYANYDEAVNSKIDTIDKAWENYKVAKADLEPMTKQKDLLDVALRASDNWRTFNVLLERHYKEPLTCKKCEIIAVTMATIPAELRDEDVKDFFTACDRVVKGRLANNGKHYNQGRFSSLVSFYRFKQILITASPLLNDYDLFQNLRKELEL